ncbi:hypothetical protein [[Erwinia] mediterraneensis]|uniref:hypothetical protein n=1 Tax=[Erwinia] mediterraneensis TaxID=2161819 RepID=UPI00103099C9|nr:hypothetical protein [[Erwinia] mediterraneensis]
MRTTPADADPRLVRRRIFAAGGADQHHHHFIDEQGGSLIKLSISEDFFCYPQGKTAYSVVFARECRLNARHRLYVTNKFNYRHAAFLCLPGLPARGIHHACLTSNTE